jgi:chloramphenicol O-acetyltransferase
MNTESVHVVLRVKHILAAHDKNKRELKGHDILAARHLYSTLYHLEQLAVLAAERGNGISNQLEDELVHRDVFKELAIQHGGLEPCPKPAQDLIDYLSKLDGAMSLATLNVVAESWLDTVFHHLEKSDLAPEVFKAIEEDERRHTYGALQAARPDPNEVKPIVRDLEQMLMEISISGEFMLPMAWFLGPTGVANMGIAISKSHARACNHLRVEPNLDKLILSCRAARFLDRTAPQQIEANEWQRLKMEIWKTSAPQYCFVDMELDPKIKNPIKIQAQVIHAIGRILAREPDLRLVLRRDSLFRTDHPVVGIRALYDEDRVITLFVSRPEKTRPKKILHLLNRQMKRIKSEPYEPYEGVINVAPQLKDLVPPQRCNVVVTYNGESGGLFGVGPLSDMEGIPTSVTFGEPRWVIEDVREENVDLGLGFFEKKVVVDRKFKSVICVQMDHRVGDGRHVGTLARKIVSEMKIVQAEGL